MSRAFGARMLGVSARSWRYHRPRAFYISRCSSPLSRSRNNSSNTSSTPNPFAGYYEDLLDKPLHAVQNVTRSPTTPPPPDELPQTEKDVVLEKARVVFGSRLAGPGERQAAIDSASTNIAGVLVPPRPEEPDNCCMSGCVNCVWDLFRDEMEDWAAKSAEARAKIMAQRQKEPPKSKEPPIPGHVAASVDEDGGGSQSNWGAEDGMESFGPGSAEKDLFEGIPVGIREFMKTEKKLKAKHAKAKSG